MRTLPLAFALALVLSACGSTDVTGTWEGTLSGTVDGDSASTDVTFTLIQDGEEVTGTYASGLGGSGSVSATVAGDTLEDLRVAQQSPCAGTFIGSATIGEDEQTLTGSVSGTDCAGSWDISFAVTRPND